MKNIPKILQLKTNQPTKQTAINVTLSIIDFH